MRLIFYFVLVFFSHQRLAALQAFPFYQLQIPNGHHIPHPCERSKIWHGVGHWKESGTGARNPFGEDFAAEGHKWTVELCQKDSDGDGRTNGEELGDPECVWNLKSLPAVTDLQKLSHPGICEPITSSKCLEKNGLILQNELCRKAYLDAGLKEQLSKVRTTRDEESVLGYQEATASETSMNAPTIPMNLPSEVVVYGGPLEEILPVGDQNQIAAPEIVLPQQNAIYQTVTVSHENYSVKVQIPVLAAEPVVSPTVEPMPMSAYAEEAVAQPVPAPPLVTMMPPPSVNVLQALEASPLQQPVIPAVIPLAGETRYYQAPTIYQTNGVEEQQQQQQAVPDSQLLYRYLFQPATYTVPPVLEYPQVEMMQPAPYEPPRIAPYQWRQNGCFKASSNLLLVLKVYLITVLAF